MGKSIRLHKEHGVNPTIEQAVCPICGKQFDTGSLLLLGHNKGKKAEKCTLTHFKECKECDDLCKERLALVECDESKSTFLPNGNLKPEGAYRSGNIMWMKKEVAANFFNIDTSKFKFVYIDKETFEKIKEKI